MFSLHFVILRQSDVSEECLFRRHIKTELSPENFVLQFHSADMYF